MKGLNGETQAFGVKLVQFYFTFMRNVSLIGSLVRLYQVCLWNDLSFIGASRIHVFDMGEMAPIKVVYMHAIRTKWNTIDFNEFNSAVICIEW